MRQLNSDAAKPSTKQAAALTLCVLKIRHRKVETRPSLHCKRCQQSAFALKGVDSAFTSARMVPHGFS